eukprot:2746988-Rhodomonas_salina.1
MEHRVPRPARKQRVLPGRIRSYVPKSSCIPGTYTLSSTDTRGLLVQGTGRKESCMVLTYQYRHSDTLVQTLLRGTEKLRTVVPGQRGRVPERRSSPPLLAPPRSLPPSLRLSFPRTVTQQQRLCKTRKLFCAPTLRLGPRRGQQSVPDQERQRRRRRRGGGRGGGTGGGVGTVAESVTGSVTGSVSGSVAGTRGGGSGRAPPGGPRSAYASDLRYLICLPDASALPAICLCCLTTLCVDDICLR